MIKRLFSVLLILLVFSGCEKIRQSSPVAIKIDRIKVTVAEFEDAFRNSFYAKEDNSDSRKAFLDNLLTRKLILKKAEKQGLDKEPDFLQDVELFWQQSLLKIMLDRKIKELALDIRVGDKEINNYYWAHKDTHFTDKQLEDVYGEIKWLILKGRQSEAMEEWLDTLRKNSKVKIKYDLLRIKE